MSATNLYMQASDIKDRVEFIRSLLNKCIKENQDHEDVTEYISDLQDTVSNIIGDCNKFMSDIDAQGGPSKVDYDASYVHARED